jgi:serine/threonine protein kinase/tetratricopeptide (TPR) repeat protein
MIGQTISHYKILEKLGEGGMGVVYKAEDTRLKRTVALKFLPREFLCDSQAKARFIHEAQAASALNHPNITTIHEIDEVEGECFIAMEYIEGKSIKELVKEKKFPIEDILRIAIQIAEGLNAAHKKDIVHRDIKSDNIMLTHDGLAKIMDFGLAKLKGATKLTTTGSTLGTLAYMSPEQAQGIELDQRSDIFSLGVVLYEMITGQLPFKGEHGAAIIYSIINETPEPLARYKANVPEGLQRVVDKALAKDKEERYQHADELLADLRHEKKNLEYVRVGQIPAEVLAPKSKRKLFPFIIPASIVFVLVLLFLILKPFKFEISPEKKATAEENTLAIMYFDNLVDPEDSAKLGEIVTNLLITDLTESQYLRVVSSQRLYDILKLLGKEGIKRVDRAIATQVAEKAKAKWMLLGSVLQIKPEIILTAQLVEVKTGNAIASQRINGQAGENIFPLVDRLTVEVKKDLSLPAVAQKELDPSVADVTTHSPEAYRYYLEGVEYNNKIYSKEAEESFRKSLKCDSTFAMAYYQLARMGTDDWKEMLEKALKYSDKVSHKEKCYIKVLEIDYSEKTTEEDYVRELKELLKRYPEEKDALMMLGSYYRSGRKFEQSIQYLNQVIEIDPLNKLAYNDLAYVYNEIGNFDKSIWAINKYISLAPDEPNPYDTRGDLYAYNGKLDQAIESYKKALEIKPDFTMSLEKLGHMYLFKREYPKAESCYYRELDFAPQGERTRSAWVRILVSAIPLYQGKFESALQFLTDGIAADRVDKIDEWYIQRKHLKIAGIYREKNNLDLTLKEIEKCMEIQRRIAPDDKISYKSTYARFLAENKEFTKAEKIAEDLKKNIKGDKNLMHYYWLIIGLIEQEKGNLEESIINLKKATESNPTFSYHHWLANAYLQAGRLDEAVAEFEKLLTRYDSERAWSPVASVKTYYLLGLAYEKSGWNKKAIEKYEEFLDIWKDADPGIKEVEDAKERLKKLKK